MENFTLKGTVSLEKHCLQKKVVFITGTSSGIGRALALEVARYGATAILTGRSRSKLEALYDEITQHGYPEPIIHPVDLLQLNPEQANLLAQNVIHTCGQLDALIHNASMVGNITPIEHLSPTTWQETIHLNLNIPFLLTQAFLPYMQTTPHSTVLFTLAQEMSTPKAYWSAFAASKAGLFSLACALHEEIQANTTLRVNCIELGKIRTAMRLNTYPGLDPLTFTPPENITPAYVYLLSHAQKAIRGKKVQLTH